NKVQKALFHFNNKYCNNMDFSLSMEDVSVDRISSEVNTLTYGIEKFISIKKNMDETFRHVTKYVHEIGLHELFKITKRMTKAKYGVNGNIEFNYIWDYKVAERDFVINSELHSKENIPDILDKKKEKIFKKIEKVRKWHDAKTNPVL